MDEARVLEEVRGAMAAAGERVARVARVAEAIRREGEYRWVGIYDVGAEEIAAIAWAGPGAPAHPRFPVTQGLCGAAVASARTIVVGDVAKDPRYLTTLGSTRSEIVVPVFAAPATDTAGENRPSPRRVAGLIDVESERPDAFTDRDRAALELCASAIRALWSA